jgi:hypothetical protein
LRLRRLCRRDCLPNFIGPCQGYLRLHLSGVGIENIAEASALSGDSLAADKMAYLSHMSEAARMRNTKGRRSLF